MTVLIKDLRPRVDSFKFSIESSSGKREGKSIDFNFSEATRGQYDLRDARDVVVSNLWDEYIAAATPVESSGPVRIEPSEPRFLILGGHRLRFNSLFCDIEVLEHEMHFEIDLASGMCGYENAVTGEVKCVFRPNVITRIGAS